MNIYLTGKYDGYKMQYAGVAIGDALSDTYCKTCCVVGETIGSKPETEMEVVRDALKFAFPYNVPVTIYTDFEGIKARVDGRIKSASQSARGLMTYVNTVKSRTSLDVEESIPSREQQVLSYLLRHRPYFRTPQGEPVPSGQWRECEIRWAKRQFSIILRHKDGHVVKRMDNVFFEDDLQKAIACAEQYERDVKDENSELYGLIVQRCNVPRLTRKAT